jgi:lipopolysaccharide export LptBFGC system permease protein LptF
VRISIPRISILERYIFRECLAPFLIALGAVTAIMVMGTAFKLLLVTKGVDVVAVLQVTPFIIPYVLIYVVPISILMGTLTAYTRLEGDREIRAMKLTGVPVTRLVTPAVFLGLALSFVCLLSANYVGPRSREQLANVAREAVIQILSQLEESRNSVLFEPKDSRFVWKIHWQGIENGKLDDIVICKEPKPVQDGREAAGAEDWQPEILYASRGSFRLDPLDNLIKFQLEGLLGDFDLAGADARSGRETEPRFGLEGVPVEGKHDRKVSFRGSSFAVTVDLNMEEWKDELDERVKNRDIDNLMALYPRDLPGAQVSRAAIRVELGRRLGESLACLSFALLGAAIGLVYRGQNRILAYLIGCVLALAVFFPLSQAGEAAAEAGALPALFSLQFGNIALLLISFVLLRRGVR